MSLIDSYSQAWTDKCKALLRHVNLSKRDMYINQKINLNLFTQF